MILGAPEGFCDDKEDGLYADPKDNTKFFNCVNYKATACQNCPATTTFSEKCGQCLNSDYGKFIVYFS